MFFDVTDFRCELLWHHVTYCIWHIKDSSTTRNSYTEHFAQEIHICTRCIFARELDFIKLALSKFQNGSYLFKDLFSCHFQFVFHVNFGCSDEHMQTTTFCIFQCFSYLLHVLFIGTSQTTNRSTLYFTSNRLHCFKIPRRCGRETSFNNINTKAYETFRNLYLFWCAKCNARCLFPITKGCIKEIYAILIHNFHLFPIII